jgi:hypothetical protein
MGIFSLLLKSNSNSEHFAQRTAEFLLIEVTAYVIPMWGIPSREITTLLHINHVENPL